MPAKGQLTLVRIRGIRVGVDYSWFLVLFLVILWLSGFYKDVLDVDASSSEPYVLAVASAIGFFASILLHEFGHAFVAIRRGIPISDITLWLFGGVARMTRDSDSPGTEFKVAVAGPLVTVLIVIVTAATGIAIAGADEFWQAMQVSSNAETSGAVTLLAWLSSINLLVLVFNLIPAFPLDGGRIARAIAWKLTGDRNRATRFAARVGQGFSYVFIAVGLAIVALSPDNWVSGIWLALIGFVLGQSARGQAVQSEFSSKIEGIRVADVMDSDPVAIPEETSVERAIDEYFLRYRWPWFPVIDTGDRFRGLIERERADSVPEPSRSSQTVAATLRDDSEDAQVRDDAPLESLLGNAELRRLGGLVAVDADGRLSGVITADQVGRALRDALGARGGG